MSFDPFASAEPDLLPKDAAVAFLTYGISIAERGPDQVAAHDYRSAHRAMLADSAARRAASGMLRRCDRPELLWSHLRSVATGDGSWALRRAAFHELLDPVLEALDRAPQPADDWSRAPLTVSTLSQSVTPGPVRWNGATLNPKAQ